MPHLTADAHRHFATHHGIASHDQLIELGMSHDDIRRLRAAGGIELVMQGAYRNPSVPFDELSRCAAVCVAHPDVVIAGPTAGRIWGLRRLPRDERVHVVAPPRSHTTKVRWVKAYRTDAIHPADVVTRPDGIRVTTRPRTALDLARFVSVLDLRSIIEQVMSDGAHTEAEMYAVAADWMTPGRPFVRRFLQQVDRRVEGRGADSHPEVVIGELLHGAGVRGLVRQFAIELPGYGPARFDLAVPAIRWAIEVDVHPAHRDDAGIASDAARDLAADAVDWLVSRVPPAGFADALPATRARLVATYRDRSAAMAARARGEKSAQQVRSPLTAARAR